ncbi:hypothetical protein OHS59_16180 [Streptomyces sp. NBC_00414]|uniref:hypothetical protein n=1 Tax=Streptomyces sp. NBC_00414 TaxID=2975739 RepID=UPI002E200F07
MAGTSTSRLALYKPDGADDINVGTDLNANYDKIDLNSNFRVCTSSTRPSSPFTGLSIFETNTGAAYVWDGSSWIGVVLSSAGTLRLTSTTDVSLSSSGHAFQIGASGAANLAMDTNEIMARSNGSAATLLLNADGGNVTVGASGSTVAVAGALTVGGQYVPQIVFRTTNLDRASTTSFAADPVLQATLAANATYHVEVYMYYGALAAADIKTQWTVPSGATGLRSCFGPGSSASDSAATNIVVRAGVHNFTTSVPYEGCRDSQSNLTLAWETGQVVTTNSGTFSLDWAQNTSNGTGSRMGAGSFMRLTRVTT